MILISILSSLLIETMGSMLTLLSAIIIVIISTIILSKVDSNTEEVKSSLVACETTNQTLVSKVDMYDIAGDLSFISQQLTWVVGHSNTALKKLTIQSKDIASESETTASSAEEASAGVEEIASNAAVVADASQQAFHQCQKSSQLAFKNQQQITEASNTMLEVAEVVQTSVNDLEELNVASK